MELTLGIMIETAVYETKSVPRLLDAPAITDPGEFVLNILREVPADTKTIVLLRHAKREPFWEIPHHLRGRVEISPEGISMARKFGESLVRITPGNRIVLWHTPANRCRMTAESIRDGCLPGIRARVLASRPELPHPVEDLEKFSALEQELGWEILSRRWLCKGVPGLSDPRAYTCEILKNLLEVPGIGSGDILIVVVHDIMIIPLLSCIFGKMITEIGFLNGIVLTSNGDFITAWFSGEGYSLKRKRIIPQDDRVRTVPRSPASSAF